MLRYITVFILLLLTGELWAQKTDSLLFKDEPIDYNAIIKEYTTVHEPEHILDSGFYESFLYLDRIFNSDSVAKSFDRILNYVNSNTIQQELKPIYRYRTYVDSLNNERKKVLGDYWERQRLMQLADTGSINTEDSLFFDMLDALMYQDTINLDSILQVLNPYNDSLMMAINAMIDSYNKHTYTKWIKQLRNDTLSLYIVNIEGDSLRVNMFNNNPSIIRFGLTNYWGAYIPAVIRDIDKRSFKIFVDDEPKLDYDTDNKAKEALGAYSNISVKRQLTLKEKNINIPKPMWSVKGVTNIDVSQVGMRYWAQGGDPSIAMLAGFEVTANYKKEHINWDNKGKFRYGVIRQGRYADTAVSFRSNEDRIEVASKFGYRLFGQNYATFEGDFKSQFTPTYKWDGNIKTDKVVSDFMSPGFITFSLGIDYKPNERTTVLVSPITSKLTYVLEDVVSIKERYNVDTTKNVRSEPGARIKLNHKIKIWDEIEMKNSLELFSNYVENPQNVDVDWDFTLIFPVNDFIRANIRTKMIYDDDTKVPTYDEEHPETYGLQIREMISIGFTAKF